MNECSLNIMFIIMGTHHPVGASDERPFNVPALSLNQRAELNTHCTFCWLGAMFSQLSHKGFHLLYIQQCFLAMSIVHMTINI